MSDDVTKQHEEKETLSVDVEIPGHDPRTTTALFTRTRKMLLSSAMDGPEGCYICGAQYSHEHPLEAHHYPVERSLADMINWERVRADAERGELGISERQRKMAKAFDWNKFFAGAKTVVTPTHQHPETGDLITQYSTLFPMDPYMFVDDMTVNGVLLCKNHHIGKDEGIHAMPHPLWIAQRYGLEGYKFSGVEIIHHAQEVDDAKD